MPQTDFTLEDARAGMRKLEPVIAGYAKLIVRKGVNVKHGQEVVVRSSVEAAAFTRTLVEEAYRAGAGHVTVIWSDDVVTRLTYEHLDVAYFEQTPEWQRVQLESLAEAGACFIFVEGPTPTRCATSTRPSPPPPRRRRTPSASASVVASTSTSIPGA